MKRRHITGPKSTGYLPAATKHQRHTPARPGLKTTVSAPREPTKPKPLVRERVCEIVRHAVQTRIGAIYTKIHAAETYPDRCSTDLELEVDLRAWYLGHGPLPANSPQLEQLIGEWWLDADSIAILSAFYQVNAKQAILLQSRVFRDLFTQYSSKQTVVALSYLGAVDRWCLGMVTRPPRSLWRTTVSYYDAPELRSALEFMETCIRDYCRDVLYYGSIIAVWFSRRVADYVSVHEVPMPNLADVFRSHFERCPPAEFWLKEEYT